MSDRDGESIADRYLRAAGHASGERYQFALEEVLWLLEHSADLGGLRLELLKTLQAALPRSDEQGAIAELKDLLTDVIIMQSRVAGREETLREMLRRLSDARPLDHVSVDKAVAREAIQRIVEASSHVHGAARDER